MVKMYLIDTNILLEVLLDQDMADDCEKLILKLNEGYLAAYISSFTMHSIEVILERNKKLDILKDFLGDALESKGLKRFDTTTLDEAETAEISSNLKLDFDDAVNYYICKILNLKIISFDRHFDKTDIERVEPKHLLE